MAFFIVVVGEGNFIKKATGLHSGQEIQSGELTFGKVHQPFFDL